MLECTLQMESLVSIRICSRDSGQHILAKLPDRHQRWLIRLHQKPRNGAGETFFGGNGHISSVLGLALNILLVFFTI